MTGVAFASCAVFLGLVIVERVTTGQRMRREKQLTEVHETPEAQTLAVDAERFDGDIAVANLSAARGLLPREFDKSEALHQLDQWAVRVKTETDRHLYRFKRSPAEFDHSEGFFRMAMMSVVLTEDFGVRYDPQRQVEPGRSTTQNAFFADANRVFLSGILGPERLGTCSSLPVLYVAIGRRLGYPLNLVTTKGHLFVRWEGKGERFNVEVTGRGVNRFEDDYYRQWPFAITQEEEAAEGYLKSLDTDGELAAFLSIRGMCLREGGRQDGAFDAFARAAKLAPQCRSYRLMAESLRARSP